jgi:hypothetical protein
MKECFLILAVLESWLLVFWLAALLGGRLDLCLALGRWLLLLGCVAWLVYRCLGPRAKRGRSSGVEV